jgi:nicotinamidase-related amidase
MKERAMLLDAEDCHLVLVDAQQRLMPVIADGPAVLANLARLAQGARLLDVPCWATEHNPPALGPLDASLRPFAQAVLPKMTFSAAEVLLPRLRPPLREQHGNARSLPKHLRKPAEPAPASPGTVLLAGCEAHVCLLQTALELLDEEFDVWVVTDACGSRTERNRDAAYDRLAGAGCELVTTEMVLFEWLRTAEHPSFSEMLALLK